MNKKPAQSLSAGYHILINNMKCATTEAGEQAINMDLAEIQQEAHAAGFRMANPVMSMDDGKIAILYELVPDPLFRPPM